MSFRFLVATVYFNGIAHGLESVEAQTDRKNDGQVRDMVIVAEKITEAGDIIVDEVVILENSQYTDIGHQAHDQPLPSPGRCFCRFDPDACIVIDHNGEPKDEDILGLEEHIESTGSCQQQEPPELVRQCEIQGRDKNEKY